MQTIYYTATDCGDGSMSVAFFDSAECIKLLEEAEPEYYRGEGGGSFTVEGEITGIHIQTLENVREELGELEEDEED